MSSENSITKAYSFKIDRLTRKMRQFSTNYLKSQDIDITVDQWGILRLLFEHKEPISQTDLAKLVIKDTPTTSRILDLLCKKGFVERKPNKDDRRKFDVILTSQGKKTVELINPLADKLRQDIFKDFTKKDFQDLERLIKAIENNME